MDNKEFVEILASKLGEPTAEINALTEGFVKVLTSAALEMDSVVVPSFGSFEVRKRKERISIHPASGKRLLIPPKLVLGFKSSTILKNRLK
ncbi:MAG: HU family DNA-binding protein [Muribaculaceae bacterium]|nr:HU family DNA-binding protein [Muribaculaceae bacterium]